MASSSKTHMGDKQTISTSLPKPQEHTYIRWREITYGHWTHPGQRTHCSSHASATATCKQSRPKQEGKDQASDTYIWLPCT